MTATTEEHRRRRRNPADDPGRAVGRYGALEGYRGLAALLIVIYHVYQYMRTGSGPTSRYPLEGTVWHTMLVGLDSFVGMFFVLSAFLLGLPYIRAGLSGTPARSGRGFLARRAVRILPLYLVAILIVWFSRTKDLPGDWRDLLEHLTFTQVFDNKRIFYTIGPAWSLAVEVHFYLLLALLGAGLVSLCRRLARPSQRLTVLLTVIVGLGIASLAWKLVAWYVLGVSTENWVVWFSLPAKLDLFVIGLLLAIVVALRGQDRAVARPVRAGLFTAGLVTLVIAFATRAGEPNPHVFFHTGTGLGFALLLAASVLVPAGRAGPILGSPVPALLGLISYSLYIWHEPVMLFLANRGLFPHPGSSFSFAWGVLIMVVVALPLAWLSYWVIEYPTSMLRRIVDESDAAAEHHDKTADRRG
jgi:peptidoglycan/LPS O-acetylase OafA/YrhL